MPRDAGLSVRVNPEGLTASAGIEFLAECFGSRWSEAAWGWHLERAFAGESPDHVLLFDGERLVAGCGLVYRLLVTPDGALHRVGVIVTAATTPEQRGRGHYARVLRAAAERGAGRGCAALLGFVTADNASGRGLLRLGASAIASAYIATRARSPPPLAGTLRHCAAPVTDRWPARAAARRRDAPREAGFHYPDVASWRAQMVQRPYPVESLRVGATGRALVEAVGDTDRLLWLDGEERERVAAIRALAGRALRRGRHFFMYSTRAGDAAAARRLGLRMRCGYLLALALGSAHETMVRGWAALPWHVQSGDRM